MIFAALEIAALSLDDLSREASARAHHARENPVYPALVFASGFFDLAAENVRQIRNDLARMTFAAFSEAR